MSSFLGLQETIAAQGLFGSLYTDRGASQRRSRG
jgi:hypothetical protein